MDNKNSNQNKNQSKNQNSYLLEDQMVTALVR